MDSIIYILAFIGLVGVPAFLAYLIGLFTYKRLVKAGNSHAQRNRIIVFSISFVVLLAAIIFLLLNSFTYDR